MTVFVQPAGSFRFRANFGPSYAGLATVGFELRDEADSVVIARTTTGVVEIGTGRGIYEYHGVAPAGVGDYLGTMDTGGGAPLYAADDVRVSGDLPFTPPTSSGFPYLTLSELKASIGMTGFTFADDEASTAIQAAARGLEDAYDAYWTLSQPDQQRYYQATERTVMLGDVLNVTAVDVDYWGGQYGVSLTPDQYRLLPIQHGLTANGGNGLPYRQLQLTRKTWPWPSIGLGMNGDLPRDPDGVRVTGTFGYEFVPAGVKTAVTILATRMLRRMREAPFGIIAVGAEGAALRSTDIRRDPEIAFAMRGVSGARSLVR